MIAWMLSLLIAFQPGAHAFVELCPEPTLAPVTSEPTPTVVENKAQFKLKNSVLVEALEDLHLEMFMHLQLADQYLRSLMNCFYDRSQKRANESEPMYTEFTSCAEIREQLWRELPTTYKNMRIHLALSEPQKMTPLIDVEREPHIEIAEKVNPEPEHRYKNLAKMAPLTPAELGEVLQRWDAETSAFNADYSQNSCLEKRLEENPAMSDGELDMWDRMDKENRLRYLIARRSNSRMDHQGAYTRILTDLPILGFIPKPFSATGSMQSEDRYMILSALVQQLRNNCVVRLLKFSDGDFSRRGAVRKCREYTNGLLARTYNSLDAQNMWVMEFFQNLNWRRPISNVSKERRNEFNRKELMVFGANSAFIQSYRQRNSQNLEKIYHLDWLQARFERQEMRHSVAEMVGFVALGVLCTVGPKRLPFLTVAMKGIGISICLFLTGLPVNTAYWFWGSNDYMDRYTEFFSQAPGKEILQDLKTLDRAKTAQALNTIFLGVGTGLPELTRSLKSAGKTWIHFKRLQKSSNGH